MLILLLIAVFLLAALALLGWALAGYALRIRPQTLEEARRWQEEHYDLSWYDGLDKEDYTAVADDGYSLHVQRLVNPAGGRGCVIISHGYTDNRLGALKYARNYLDMGLDVIVYDLRGHGLNAPDFCTYSVREGRDLAALIRDTRKRCPRYGLLGLHGESLGAAATIACLKYRPAVDFAVSDCAFSDIRPVLRSGLKGMHLPGSLVHLASLAARLRYGYGFEAMRPIDSLAGDRTPILFLHGAQDTFILPAHCEALNAASKDHSRMRLIPGAGHAESVLKAPDLYRDLVTDFVRGVMAKKAGKEDLH